MAACSVTSSDPLDSTPWVADGPLTAAVVDALDPDAVPVCVAPARIVRIWVSFAPYAAVTRTPATETSTWSMSLTAAAAVAAAGSAAFCGRAALVLGSTTADDGALAGLTAWMNSDSVWPRAVAGQSCALPGVPR